MKGISWAGIWTRVYEKNKKTRPIQGDSMILPKLGSPQWAEEVDLFLSSDTKGREKRAHLYDMQTTSYMRRMNERGIHLNDKEHTVVVEEGEPERIPYPDLKIKPFREPKTSRDEEDIGLILADWHLGKITESYSIKMAEERAEYLLDSLMSIINLHRPIRKLWVFITGDMVQGENPHQGSRIGEVECCAYEQIHTHAIPLLTRFLCSLNRGVQEVEVVAVCGNHGRYDKIAPDKTNWDAFLYSGLESALINQKHITINPPTNFYQLTNIRGFRFFQIHGDQVNATQGIPLFAMRRKMQEWYAYVGGFNYGYAGHFHSGAYDQVNSLADYTICPPLVTGDSWALEKVGRASEPKQLCFGIHDKYGRTFEYKLHTDDDFLPQKFDEPEGVIRKG